MFVWTSYFQDSPDVFLISSRMPSRIQSWIWKSRTIIIRALIQNQFRHQMARRLIWEDFNQTNIDDCFVRIRFSGLSICMELYYFLSDFILIYMNLYWFYTDLYGLRMDRSILWQIANGSVQIVTDCEWIGPDCDRLQMDRSRLW